MSTNPLGNFVTIRQEVVEPQNELSFAHEQRRYFLNHARSIQSAISGLETVQLCSWWVTVVIGIPSLCPKSHCTHLSDVQILTWPAWTLLSSPWRTKDTCQGFRLPLLSLQFSATIFFCPYLDICYFSFSRYRYSTQRLSTRTLLPNVAHAVLLLATLFHGVCFVT